jgi:hypothetical protein
LVPGQVERDGARGPRSFGLEFLEQPKKPYQSGEMPNATVSSGDLERSVSLSSEEYRRLKTGEQDALYPWELDDGSIRALMATEPSARTAAFDHETTNP